MVINLKDLVGAFMKLGYSFKLKFAQSKCKSFWQVDVQEETQR